tara:strand:+ start:478 stop:1179 length:702 start_codon:yes stop_codon:yes gene_type:complete
MIRNIFFFLFFYLGIILILILFIPTLFFPKKCVHFGGRLMGIWTGICLKLFLNVSIMVKGLENIPSDKKYFIVCSHQSMFETFFLQTIFYSSVFILKKELMKIPLFGAYLKKMGCVSIDRDKISKENLGFTGLVEKVLDDKNNTLIIFPQGTRKDFKDRSKFKKGFTRIYKDLQISCLPIAINSGKTWPKSSFLKSNQSITISILKSFEPGQELEQFSAEVESLIYKELDLIN